MLWILATDPLRPIARKMPKIGLAAFRIPGPSPALHPVQRPLRGSTPSRSCPNPVSSQLYNLHHDACIAAFRPTRWIGVEDTKIKVLAPKSMLLRCPMSLKGLLRDGIDPIQQLLGLHHGDMQRIVPGHRHGRRAACLENGIQLLFGSAGGYKPSWICVLRSLPIIFIRRPPCFSFIIFSNKTHCKGKSAIGRWHFLLCLLFSLRLHGGNLDAAAIREFSKYSFVFLVERIV